MCRKCTDNAEPLRYRFHEATQEILTDGGEYPPMEVLTGLLMNAAHWFRFVQGEREDGPILPIYEDIEKRLRMVWENT